MEKYKRSVAKSTWKKETKTFLGKKRKSKQEKNTGGYPTFPQLAFKGIAPIQVPCDGIL